VTSPEKVKPRDHPKFEDLLITVEEHIELVLQPENKSFPGDLSSKVNSLKDEFDFASGENFNSNPITPIRTPPAMGKGNGLVLTPALALALAAYAVADDKSQSLESRARSYLAMNCVQHRPGGPAPGNWDARITTRVRRTDPLGGGAAPPRRWRTAHASARHPRARPRGRGASQRLDQ
jgi:hypothetical protein